MKKFLGTIILGFLLIISNVNAGIYLNKGQTYEGEIPWSNKMILTLPPGEWKVTDRWGWSVGGVKGKGVTLHKEINNTLDEVIELSEIRIRGWYQSYVTDWLQEVFFKDQHDGCYQRPEYYLTKVKKKGSFFNCFIVRHTDTEKLLFAPDDPMRKASTAIIRKYLREHNIEVPKMTLSRGHHFFATSVIDSYYGVFYLFNPETQGGPKNKFLTENTSEYHRSNIENYPKHKKYMEDFVISAVYEQKKFEKMVHAKSRHVLDFSEYNIEEPSNTTTTTTTSGSQLTEQLKELKQLYDDGVLTKEEFTKAKKKLLD